MAGELVKNNEKEIVLEYWDTYNNAHSFVYDASIRRYSRI